MEEKKKSKRANHTGTIRKLSGNRKNPYAVYPPVTEYNEKGSPINGKAIGYFSCRTKAEKALREWHKNKKNTI